MAYLEINPAYQPFFLGLGLRAADDFLRWPGVIVNGHPDRHVLQLAFENNGDRLDGFMKREHRSSLRRRLVNAWDGFGLVSVSRREAIVLKETNHLGVAPECLATGENGHGQGFVLVRHLSQMIDVRQFLENASPQARRDFAHRLAALVAKIHNAGFDHPDLCAKHVLVDPVTHDIRVLDWQRSCRWKSVGLHLRCRDMAMLHATIAHRLAGEAERMVFIREYARAAKWDRETLQRAQNAILLLMQTLVQRRRIREQQQLVSSAADSRLIWLDGEALCVTPEFHASLNRRRPSWLNEVRASRQVAKKMGELAGPTVMLTQRSIRRPLTHLWSWIRGTRPTTPEVRQAGLIFRLQRHGIATPKLLAFGQRQRSPGRTDSFILIESERDAMPLMDWCRRLNRRSIWTAERKARWQVIRSTGVLLRRLHNAGCFIGAASQESTDTPLTVQRIANGTWGVSLVSIGKLKSKRRLSQGDSIADVRSLYERFGNAHLSTTDRLRFVLTYLDAHRLTPEVRKYIRAFVSSRSSRNTRRVRAFR